MQLSQLLLLTSNWRPSARRGCGRLIVSAAVAMVMFAVGSAFFCGEMSVVHAAETGATSNDLSAADAVRTIAYTTNQNSESLSVVAVSDDGVPMRLLAEIKVPGKPAGIALSPDQNTIYVTAPEAKELVVIDAATRTVKKRVAVGEGPLGLAVNPVNGDVLVADWYQHKLRVLDPASLVIKGEVSTGKSPSGVAVTSDGRLILTTDRDSDQVSLIDAAVLKVIATVPVGERPFGITIDKTGTRAYTANVKSNDVSAIDIPAAKTIASYKVGRRPYAVALTGGRAFVTDQYSGTVTVIDLAKGQTEKAISVGEHPEGIMASASGRFVYVACWMENTLERIDTTTLKVTDKVEVGDGPRAFGDFLAEGGKP